MISLLCPHCQGPTSHEWIGHQVRGVYDGILFWVCPMCDFARPRFVSGAGRLAVVSREYAQEYNDAREVAEDT